MAVEAIAACFFVPVFPKVILTFSKRPQWISNAIINNEKKLNRENNILALKNYEFFVIENVINTGIWQPGKFSMLDSPKGREL